MAKAYKIENFQRKLRPNPLFFSFVDTDQVLVGSGKKASLAARSKGRGRELRALTEQGRSKGDSAVLFSRKNGHMDKTNCIKVVLECWGKGNGPQGGKDHDAGVPLSTCV